MGIEKSATPKWTVTQPWWCSDRGLPASRAVTNTILLFISHPVRGIFYSRAKGEHWWALFLCRSPGPGTLFWAMSSYGTPSIWGFPASQLPAFLVTPFPLRLLQWVLSTRFSRKNRSKASPFRQQNISDRWYLGFILHSPTT